MVPEGGAVSLDSILEGILSEREEGVLRMEDAWRHPSLLYSVKTEQPDSCTEDYGLESPVCQSVL